MLCLYPFNRKKIIFFMSKNKIPRPVVIFLNPGCEY